AGARSGVAGSEHHPRADRAVVELASIRDDDRRARRGLVGDGAQAPRCARRTGQPVHSRGPLAVAAVVPAVSMVGITKRFPGVVANDHVDFEAAAGEVHALLGENGAGKTTLSNVLTGLYRPDEGEIRLFGEPMSFESPRDAIDAGVCMVHQHFRLVERFTVAENLILGDRRGAGSHFVIDPRAVEGQVQELGERYELSVDPRAHVWQLSVG